MLSVDCMRMCNYLLKNHRLVNITPKLSVPIDINNANASTLLSSRVNYDRGTHHIAYM